MKKVAFRSHAASIPSLQGLSQTLGRPLESTSRQFFESRFAHDFSKVRVHSDNQTTLNAQLLEASAFTIGRDIYIGADSYRPETSEGKRLLAHELVHTIQNGENHTQAGTVTDMTDRSEVEAEQIANQTMRLGPMMQPRIENLSSAHISRQAIKPKPNAKVLAATHGGNLVVRRFDTYYERASPDEGSQAIDCEFAFVRNADTEYGDPSKLNWFQTVQTNYETSSNETPPESTEVSEFVDGDGPANEPGNRDEARWWSKVNGSYLKDTLHRRSLPDREVIWKAQTSLVGISDQGLQILATVEWGFTLTRTGDSKVMRVKRIDTPSPYHQRKFQELRIKEE